MPDSAIRLRQKVEFTTKHTKHTKRVAVVVTECRVPSRTEFLKTENSAPSFVQFVSFVVVDFLPFVSYGVSLILARRKAWGVAGTVPEWRKVRYCRFRTRRS